MQQSLKILHKTTLQGNVQLPASKSISNRLLIINALSGNKLKINNLSTANDTQLLINIFKTLPPQTLAQPFEVNCEDAGTVMRFLTAYFAITPGKWLLKGTERMHNRPISILVEKLKKLDAEIEYLGNHGYPPLLITGKPLQGGTISIDATVSSQYISALMMISPYLQNGLEIVLDGEIASLPYIKMTAQLMQQCGAKADFNTTIVIQQGHYSPSEITVESDWSGASYWYAMAAVAKTAKITLEGLQQNSIQGDSVVAKWMEMFGVHTRYTTKGVALTKTEASLLYFKERFDNCPDLAPTFIALCAALELPAAFYGLESLAIKESDRTAALAKELLKLNVFFKYNDNEWKLPANTKVKETQHFAEFDTYNDHRLAMAFAIFPFVLPEIIINNPEVVKKSYPTFWSDFEECSS
jgi:3-phosphoshikimate 1-carboxyvinyltransferase